MNKPVENLVGPSKDKGDASYEALLTYRSEVTMSKVNLNTYVAVILTDFGARHYNKYKAQFSNKFYVYEPVNKGHQIRYPLWELMNIFGPTLTMGFHSVPFENNEIEFLR